MEAFTDVDAESFVKYHRFRCPGGTDTHFEQCIAVTGKWGQILTAIYSVLVTLLFTFCWEIAVIAGISFSNSLKSRREATGPDTGSTSGTKPKYDEILRGIAWVGFWNAREPLGATGFIFGYLFRLLAGETETPVKTRRLLLRLLLLGLLGLVGTYLASVLVAAELISGNVAPANPNRVYVPKPPGEDSADIMRMQALRAPATLRSLGSAEAASDQHTIRRRVTLDPYPVSGDSLQYFTYKYTVTAQDMGLQKWYDLKQDVSGKCDVDSSWFSKNIPGEDLDVYRPWGLENTTVGVVYDGERKTAPYATAVAFPYAQTDFLTDQPAKHRYGIIVHSSHRASHRPGTDLWYKTEPFTPRDNDTDARIENYPGNRVMGGRPALSCEQKDVWSYNGTQFKNIYELTDGANIDFPDGWITQLQLDFALPRIIDVINSAGSSSLVSSTTFVSGRFDAETSKVVTDMKRLFTATWISSAHTFRNMVMVNAAQNIDNNARTGTGQPQKGVDLFVVSTPQVATLRLSVLLSIPALLFASSVALLVLKCCYHCNKGAEWHKNQYFAEGAYLFARTQYPEFTDVGGLRVIIDGMEKHRKK